MRERRGVGGSFPKVGFQSEGAPGELPDIAEAASIDAQEQRRVDAVLGLGEAALV